MLDFLAPKQKRILFNGAVAGFSAFAGSFVLTGTADWKVVLGAALIQAALAFLTTLKSEGFLESAVDSEAGTNSKTGKRLKNGRQVLRAYTNAAMARVSALDKYWL